MIRCKSRLTLAFSVACLFGVGLAMSPGSAEASFTVFDTFGPGDSYAIPTPYGVDGDMEWQAFRFVPSASGTLDTITVALGRTGTATAATQFDLFDGTDSTRGTLLESIIVPNTVAVGLGPGAVVSFSSLLGPSLISGQNYWLSYTEPGMADGSSSIWFLNDQGIGGTRLTSSLPADASVLPAFRIEVASPIPAPGAFLLVTLGTSLVGYMHRRRSLDAGATRG